MQNIKRDFLLKIQKYNTFCINILELLCNFYIVLYFCPTFSFVCPIYQEYVVYVLTTIYQKGKMKLQIYKEH